MEEKNTGPLIFHVHATYIISGSRVSQLPMSYGQTDRRTDGQAQTNMPPQLLRSRGHNKKKIWRLGGEGVGVWLRQVIFFLFQKNPSLKKNSFLFEGVKVREDWLV